MISILLSLGGLGLAWGIAALALERVGARPLAPEERFDAIIVLGCRVRADGSPSPALVRRVALGCALLRQGRAGSLVVTGGQVGGPVTEADAAMTYLTTHALAEPSQVLLERSARNTRENARFTRALLGDVRVLVVSDAWHVPRAARIFGRSFTHVKCAGAPGRFRGALREVPALSFDLLGGR